MVKCLPVIRETWVQSLGQKDPLEKEMATHSSTLAWKIPWTEEPGRLQSMGSQRVTSCSFFLSLVGNKTRITHIITVISSGGFILSTRLLLLGNRADLGSKHSRPREPALLPSPWFSSRTKNLFVQLSLMCWAEMGQVGWLTSPCVPVTMA